DPRIIALDFGIVGQLSPQDQYYLAENFMAIFQRDYRRIAELHVQAGWMPATVRLEELEAAVRGVCEPYFTRPLSQVSLAEVLLKLFRTAQRYQLTLQPQLILLQKTLLNIEGVSRTLDPQIDIWAEARPVLETILRERYSLRRVFKEARRHLPELATQAPEMPRLLHQWLQQQVDGQHQLSMRSDDLKTINASLQQMQRRVIAAVVGVGMVVAAVLALVPGVKIVCGVVGAIALIRAWWK